MNLDKKIEKSVRDKNEAQEEEALLFMNPFPGFDVIQDELDKFQKIDAYLPDAKRGFLQQQLKFHWALFKMCISAMEDKDEKVCGELEW